MAESGLESYNRMIQEMSEKRIAEDNALLEEARRRLPEEIAKLKDLDNETLVRGFRDWSCRGFADPRMTAEVQKLAEAAKVEILRRMGQFGSWG